MADRKQNGTFEKGVSGNPGGMPKEIAEVKRKLRALLPDATAALGRLLKHKDGKVRVMAVREIYDRTMGKPTQPLSDPDGKPLTYDLVAALERLAGG